MNNDPTALNRQEFSVILASLAFSHERLKNFYVADADEVRALGRKIAKQVMGSEDAFDGAQKAWESTKQGSGGKYDLYCEDALLITGAEAACLVICNGKKGSGFSISTRSVDLLQPIALALEHAAAQIKKKAAN